MDDNQAAKDLVTAAKELTGREDPPFKILQQGEPQTFLCQMPLPKLPEYSDHCHRITNNTRQHFTRPREQVEERICDWQKRFVATR